MSPPRPFLNTAEERAVRIHAAGVARRNRPTTLLVAAALALIVALAFSLLSVRSARAARRDLTTAAATSDGVDRVIDEIDALRRNTASARTDGRYSRQLQLSKLAAINQDVGLPTAPSLQEQRPRSPGPDSPIEKRIVDVTMNSAPLDLALQWINEAQRVIPGLFVSAIELRPQGIGWSVRVQVARWELKP